MLLMDESRKASGGLGPVMERFKCQKKEKNTMAGEVVKRKQANEQPKFSCPTHSAQSLDILPLNGIPAEGWLSKAQPAIHKWPLQK